LTCQEKLNGLLELYDRVTLLSSKNDCRVIRMRHKELQRDLVLHILPKPNPIYETLRGLRCENLPAVYEVFELDDGMIVLEEYVEGLNVGEIAETGRYRKRGAKKVVKEVCLGLSVLHKNGIIHRDIKPENIMVDKNGRVVLIDFNAARRIQQKSRDTEIMGTVGYASPEQLGITQSDERTDIYAVGILLNVLLLGKHPSEKIASGRMGKIVRKCTAVNPEDRYQSAEKLAYIL